MSAKVRRIPFCDICEEPMPEGDGTHDHFGMLLRSKSGWEASVDIHYPINKAKQEHPDICLNCADKILKLAQKQLANRVKRNQERGLNFDQR